MALRFSPLLNTANELKYHKRDRQQQTNSNDNGERQEVVA